MLKSNLTKEMFPNPQQRSVVMEPVCHDIEIHIWRLLFDALQNKQRLKIERKKAVGFQDKKTRVNQTFWLDNSQFKKQHITVKGATPGLVLYEFPQPSGLHIMRGILTGNPRLDRDRMTQSVERAPLSKGVKRELSQQINSQSDFWYIQLILTLLEQNRVRLSRKDKLQFTANTQWFNENFVS